LFIILLNTLHDTQEVRMSAVDNIKTVLVVGAGIMGHSIAQVFAQAGVRVKLVDVRTDILEHARHLINHNLQTLAEFGRVKDVDIPQILKQIQMTTDLVAAAGEADFAIEAVVEVPAVKQEIFRELDNRCPSHTILASNTSSLDIFDIVKIENPHRMLVTHWFTPPHIIPLVEVVPGPDTNPHFVTLTAELMKKLGKRPVVMKQFVRSFIVNRIQNNISLAVQDLLQNGLATPAEIDLAVKASLGVRLPIVGVVQTMDFTGLDLVYQIMQNVGMENKIIEEKFKRGHLGAKTSKGIYDYGGRPEAEILRKRDRLYLKMLDHLENINAFEPV
jgi:3-hydroxybutyryl-CoA dehydrogenase